MKRKKIPRGVYNFKEMIEKNYYYVDKTLLIEELIEKGSKAVLITRPRRFGKSLNMNMLKHFFDIKGRESNRKLFSGLKIEKSEHMEEFGKYPTIYLSMKDLEGNTFKDMEELFKEKIRSVFNEFCEIREGLSISDRLVFDSIWLLEEKANYKIGIKLLSQFLLEYYGVEPVVLIDEYDAPYIEAKNNGYLEEARSFFKVFYSSTLKDGINSLAVVTGILKIVKESIFSGLNNLEVATILDDDYNYFGMREEEVEDILTYYNLETTMNDTRAWYNGYFFGGKTVYNPWSIINHCIKGELTAFWVNTSANILIKESLNGATKETYESLYRLANDGEIVAYIDKDMVLGDHYGEIGLFSLMLFSGYLTVKEKIREGKYVLKIPNYEVKTFFSKIFLSLAEPNGNSSVMKLEDALREGNILGRDGVEATLTNLFENYVSYHDTSKYEIFYHNILLGIMIGFERDYHVSSNVESGHGRYDLAMIGKKNNMPSYLFEFKVAESESKMDKLGIDALTQIRERKYSSKLGNDKVINEIAVIFHKKKLKVYTDKE